MFLLLLPLLAVAGFLGYEYKVEQDKKKTATKPGNTAAPATSTSPAIPTQTAAEKAAALITGGITPGQAAANDPALQTGINPALLGRPSTPSAADLNAAAELARNQAANAALGSNSPEGQSAVQILDSVQFTK